MPNGHKKSPHTAAAQRRRALAKVEEDKEVARFAAKLASNSPFCSDQEIAFMKSFAKKVTAIFKRAKDNLFISSIAMDLRVPVDIAEDPAENTHASAHESNAWDWTNHKIFTSVVKRRCKQYKKKTDKGGLPQKITTSDLTDIGLDVAKFGGRCYLMDTHYHDEWFKMTGNLFIYKEKTFLDSGITEEELRKDISNASQYFTINPPKINTGERKKNRWEIGALGSIWMDYDAPSGREYRLALYNDTNPTDQPAGTVSKNYKTKGVPFNPRIAVLQRGGEW